MEIKNKIWKKKIIFFVVLFIFFSRNYAQVISSKKWSDLFSYNNVLSIKEDNGKIIAVTENGIFYYNLSSGEITKLSKANGLHEVKISAFDYNPSTKIGLVGYTNGTMDVITPDDVTYIVDIPIATGFTGDKRINHISITDDKAVISVDYGVSIFDLKKKEFAQSAFFLTGSTFESVNEATIKNDKVYAATATGLKTHPINVTFPVFSTWTVESAGNFIHADSENVIAIANATNVYIGTGGAFSQISQSFINIIDVAVTSQNITVTDKDRVYVFSNTGTPINSASFGEECNTANMIAGQLYGGTKLSGIKDINNNTYKPDGPYSNRSYKIHVQDGKLWVSTGGREGRYNTANPDPKKLGFYYFTGTEWVYSTYFKNNTSIVFNVLDVVPNPSDLNEVFFTNYYPSNDQGFYKMKYDPASKDFSLVKFYTTVTSPSQIYFNRPVGLAFDENNNLFATISFILKTEGGFTAALAAYNKTADTFSIKNINAGTAVQKPIIYEGKLWIPYPRNNEFGVVDYNNSALNFSDDKIYTLTEQNGLPGSSIGTISTAIDKNDDLWIGTSVGIRILSDAPTSVENNPQLENVVIEQNGLAEELFRDSNILQIEVDSGNHKWVSVDGGGAYFLSSTGEQTLKHFTRENSPIPTNVITDIKVDNKTGKVYFVTFDGIVVYQGDVADVTSNFGNVLVYPNPVVYSNFKGVVTIRGLAEKTNIRIADAAGNLVHQAVARGGFYEWNLNNQRGKRVASGIYYVLMTNEDGTDKATAKIAVVN